MVREVGFFLCVYACYVLIFRIDKYNITYVQQMQQLHGICDPMLLYPFPVITLPCQNSSTNKLIEYYMEKY